MKVKMEDVAKLAGVNKATVSRALKGDSRISSATREKVWEAARSLGYQPDAVARGLSSNRTGLLGIVFEDLTSPWTGEFLGGVDRVVSKQHYSLLVKCSGKTEAQRLLVARDLASRNVDGIIWIGRPFFPIAIDGPLVVVDSDPIDVEGIHVVVDVKRGAEKILKIAEGKRCEVEEGEKSFFKGLAPLLKGNESLSDSSLPFRIINSLNLTAIKGCQKDVLLCGYPHLARLLGYYCLDWPAFELGAVAGRLSLNVIQGKGVRPEKIVVVPPLYSPEGDVISL
ncbi:MULTISPECIES: LacI family DNA-binding transcriptional regulator [Aminobacterium]|uniref:LacI family DNA-binding transcriptional regulator n=1 Tax=Aminobacterium TaxID=81466 RepID=UPI00257B352F|nr:MULTISPECIES: LacI family DNA-binding transcriptional regulator [unclassified Aminobacterium]